VWLYHSVNADANNVSYLNGYAARIEVTILDNDIPDLRIIESDDTTEVAEEGKTTDTYTVSLLSPPSAAVQVSIQTDGQTLVDAGAGFAATAQLSFTSADWNDRKTVTVKAVDDDVFEDAHTSTIAHNTSSADPDYNALTRNVVADVADNDCGVWGFHPMDYTGPDGNPDCVVNVYDFAEFAQYWLFCTEPFQPGCQDMRADE